jgi:hypothetical protein
MRTGYVGGHIAADYITHASPFASVCQFSEWAGGWTTEQLGSIFGVVKKFFLPRKGPDWH